MPTVKFGGDGIMGMFPVVWTVTLDPNLRKAVRQLLLHCSRQQCPSTSRQFNVLDQCYFQDDIANCLVARSTID